MQSPACDAGCAPPYPTMPGRWLCSTSQNMRCVPAILYQVEGACLPACQNDSKVCALAADADA